MSHIEVRVKKIIAEFPGLPRRDLGNDEVTNEWKLDEDLGLDAVDAVDLVRSLGGAFGIELPAEAAEDVADRIFTVADAVRFIENTQVRARLS